MDFFGEPKIGHFWSIFFQGFCKKGPFLGVNIHGGVCNFIAAKFYRIFTGCKSIRLLDGSGRLHCFSGIFPSQNDEKTQIWCCFLKFNMKLPQPKKSMLGEMLRGRFCFLITDVWCSIFQPFLAFGILAISYLNGNQLLGCPRLGRLGSVGYKPKYNPPLSQFQQRQRCLWVVSNSLYFHPYLGKLPNLAEKCFLQIL